MSDRLVSLEGVTSELLQGPVSSEDRAESVDFMSSPAVRSRTVDLKRPTSAGVSQSEKEIARTYMLKQATWGPVAPLCSGY